MRNRTKRITGILAVLAFVGIAAAVGGVSAQQVNQATLDPGDVQVGKANTAQSVQITVNNTSGGNPSGGFVNVSESATDFQINSISSVGAGGSANGVTSAGTTSTFNISVTATSNTTIDVTLDVNTADAADDSPVTYSAVNKAGTSLDSANFDVVNSGGLRIVTASGGNTPIVFEGETEINVDAGVFRGAAAPSDFVRDGVPLEIDQSGNNEVTTSVPDGSSLTFTGTGPASGRSVQVVDPQIESDDVQFIDTTNGLNNGVELGDPVRVEQANGTSVNVQIGVDYGYAASTELDPELVDASGSERTSQFLVSSRDRGVSSVSQLTPSSRITGADGDTYDAVFNFSIDETGEYEFVIEALDGTDRPDNRDVGFTDSGTSRTSVFSIIDDEDLEIELGQTSAFQGERVSYDLVGVSEDETAVVRVDAEDLRFDDFGQIFKQNANNFRIGESGAAEFARNALPTTEDGVFNGHIFVARTNNPLGLGANQGDYIVHDAAGNTLFVPNGSRTGFDLTTPADRTTLANALQNDNVELDSVFNVITRDSTAQGEIDTEKLDDTGVDIEVYGDQNDDSIDLGIDGSASAATRQNLLERTVFTQTDGTLVQDQIVETTDDSQLQVDEAQIGINQPARTYVPGQEVTLNGTVSEGVEEVDVFVRDRDNYFQVANIDVANQEYDEEDFLLSQTTGQGGDTLTDEAAEIVGQPGVYRYGVIDRIDTDLAAARAGVTPQGTVSVRNGQGDRGLTSSEFNSGASAQQSIRVAEPTLEADFRTFDNSVFQEDGIDLQGTLIGPREYVIVFIDSRGSTVSISEEADRLSGEIDEDDLPLGQLSTGTIGAHVFSPGRDTEFGSGSFDYNFDVPSGFGGQSNFDGAQATQSAFRDLVAAAGAADNTRTQVREILLSQTVEAAGSDDLVVSERFRVTEDSRTQIQDVVPASLANNVSGVVPIEIGETMVVRGTTNRNPDDATIVVEAEEGPTIAELGTAIADEWPADGESDNVSGGSWSVELTVGPNVEPGNYTIQSDDGERISEANVQIVPEGAAPDRTVSNVDRLRQRISELEDQVEFLQGQLDQANSTIEDLNQQLEEAQQSDSGDTGNNGTDGDSGQGQNNDSSSGQGGQSQPGFTAVAALISLIAVALLALRREDE